MTRTPAAALALCIIGGWCAAGCGAAPPLAPATAAVTVSSNIARGDYAGSKACAGCHAAVTAAWDRSPMRSMTRLAAKVPVEPVFDGRAFEYKDDRATLFSAAGERYMRVGRGAAQPALFRVTKVIGGRYREDFIGQRLAGTEPGGAPAEGHEERVLPVSYLLKDGALRYKGYSVLVPERPYLGRGAVWRQTCIVCHNTMPHLATLYDDLLGPGEATPHLRSKKYLGSVSDQFLPPAQRIELHVTSPDGLDAALRDEIAALGGQLAAGADPTVALETAILTTRKKLGESHLIELGIGCEACHGGSREHAQEPGKKPTFAPVSRFLSVTGAGGRPLSRAEQINHVCARCHTVLFSGYKPTWEGGERPAGGSDSPDSDEDAAGQEAAAQRSPGGATINSGEARDYLLGGCASKMACTDCHDPHAADGFGDRRAAMGRVCEKCHSQYASPAKVAAHTHHRADGAGSECLNCHMARKNMGLDYRLTRYHRIGSPSDPARVLRDRPVECALCHDDKSVGELVETMSAWWGKSYDRGALTALYGAAGLGENALLITIARGKPHEQAVAAAVLGERGRKDAAARLIPVLSNEIPLVRYFARSALESLLGAAYPWDVGAGDAARPAQAQAWIAHQMTGARQ